jgi:hypothetical protein
MQCSCEAVLNRTARFCDVLTIAALEAVRIANSGVENSVLKELFAEDPDVGQH